MPTVVYPNCFCCGSQYGSGSGSGSGDGSTVGSCCDETVFTSASFTLSGVTTSVGPGDCSVGCDMTVFNRSWSLTASGTNEWEESIGIAANCDGQTSATANLFCDGSGLTLVLFIGVDAYIVYSTALANVVCPGVTTLALDTIETSPCAENLPATIDVTTSP